jgi:nitrite reductase/ring-hydroxylating ferredoxin subunit
MLEKLYTWHKIAETLTDLAPDTIHEFTLADKKICITIFNNTPFACQANCPHAGVAFANNGYVDARGNIVCPKHFYKFNLQNGQNTSGQGYPMRTYPIQQRPTGVYVGILQQ